MTLPSDSLSSWLTAAPIAHRGLHGRFGDRYRSENSLSAFQFAAEHRLAIELDVRLTSDGRAVVFHDRDLERMTGVHRAIAETSLGDIRGLRLHGTDESIPTLAEVLDLAAGRVPVLIELKSDRPVGPLESAVLDAITDRSTLLAAVQSFSPKSVDWFRRRAPSIPRGQLASRHVQGVSAARQWLLRRYALNWLTRPHFIAHDLADLPFWAASLWRRAGIPLLAWTARGIHDIGAALAVADNCIFEAASDRELNEVLQSCRSIPDGSRNG
jgi:glycerophosphoryl diester phosphodiesterase